MRRLFFGLAVLVVVGAYFAVDGRLMLNAGLEPDVENVLSPPGAGHLWGTDSLGRDLLGRTLRGYGFSLVLAVLSSLIAGAVGVGLGAWAGWMGGRTDLILMRVIEILESVPDLLLMIVLGLVLGLIFPGHVATLALALGLSGWFEIARQTRVLTLRERGMLYADAAVALGASRARVLFRHIWPNIQASVWILLLLQVPGFILAEASLSFFGFGVQPPQPSLGQIFVEGWRVMSATTHVLWAPTALLFFTLIFFRLITYGSQSMFMKWAGGSRRRRFPGSGRPRE